MRAWHAFAAMAAFLVAVGVVLFLWWDFDVRWRPRAIDRGQATIAPMLSGAGWVASPGASGAKLYVVAVRNCAACDAFDKAELPKLQTAGVDVRIIMLAPVDVNGQPKSTPAERATVAELWVNRSWALWQAWMAAPAAAWTAPHIPPADGDAARTAVVQSGRDLAAQLQPPLKSNGLRLDYPLLVWWAADGGMQASAGAAPRTWRYMEKDLTAPPK